MTIEEMEDLTSSTLSDSTQSPMTLSNISSSQQMSLSLHSEASNISHLSETEKHEMEETVDSGNDELAKGYDEEMQESVSHSEEDSTPVLLDEKFIVEQKDSEKHVRFPQEDTTTDVLYSNEQLSQSIEVASITTTSLSEEETVFAHCAVDELSRGRPKEKLVEEEKEAASLSSSLMTDIESVATSSTFDDLLSETKNALAAQDTLADTAEQEISVYRFEKHVSFDDGSPDSQTGPSVDFSTFTIQSTNGLSGTMHPVLSYTSSIEAQPPSEVYSLQSDEPELSPSSTFDALHDAPTTIQSSPTTSTHGDTQSGTVKSPQTQIVEETLVPSLESPSHAQPGDHVVSKGILPPLLTESSLHALNLLALYCICIELH